MFTAAILSVSTDLNMHLILQFAFSMIYGSRMAAKNGGRPGLIHHVSGHEVDVGGRGRY